MKMILTQRPVLKANVPPIETCDAVIGDGVEDQEAPVIFDGMSDERELLQNQNTLMASVQGQRARAENRRLEALAAVCRRCVDVPWSVVRSEGGPYGRVNEVALRLELLIDAAASRLRALHSSHGHHPEVL